MHFLIYFLLLLFVSSCSSTSLSVQTEYWNPKDLASVRVGTPDPEKNSNNFGQHIYISWTLPSNTNVHHAFLQINIRLKNGELLQKTVPIQDHRGVYCYPILGDDYVKKGGLLSYLIVLFSDKKEVAVSKHIFWVDEVIKTEETKSPT